MSYTVQIQRIDSSDSSRLGTKKAITPTDNLTARKRITVGTTEVDIDHSTDIATPGYITLINHGSTDTISVGFATGVYELEIRPGESQQFRRESTKAARLFVVSDNTNDSENLEYEFRAD